jgi:CheY-like chemotaxis protein
MSGKLIFLIDHDDGIREVVQVCLRHLAGWKVVVINSLQDGLNCLSDGKPDAILVDSLMPAFHGVGLIQKRLLQQFKAHPLTQSIPVLLLTDEAAWLSPDQLQSMGVDGAIAKPFDPAILPYQISQILGWQPISIKAGVTPQLPAQ